MRFSDIHSYFLGSRESYLFVMITIVKVTTVSCWRADQFYECHVQFRGQKKQEEKNKPTGPQGERFRHP